MNRHRPAPRIPWWVFLTAIAILFALCGATGWKWILWIPAGLMLLGGILYAKSPHARS